MRVIGGTLRGRALAAPKSKGIRPTADRLREALFNILAHAYGDPLGGARVLDLFAGTGVSRVFRRDATKLGPAHPVEPFSLVFLDPPYGQGFAEKALASARDGGWLKPDALIVVEEAKKSAFTASPSFAEIERRGYDDTEFVMLRLAIPV